MERLDLHGVQHEDVKREVIHFIEDNWCNMDDLEVITGHSSVMKSIVISTIREYKLPYLVGSMLDATEPKIIFWTETEEV